ncbi:MAG: RNA polymerase sigma factor [Blastocatellia bacterium]
MEFRSDEQLIADCRNGDKSAWEDLIRRYERLIYAIARRAGLDTDESADVFQQVFLLLVKNLNNIKQPAQIQAWLVTTARREMLRLHSERKRQRITLSIDNPEQTIADELPDKAELSDQTLLRLETQHRVRMAMKSIDERCQKLLDMLFYRDKSPPYSEISVELGISEGSIGPTRARCLQKLLEFL